jgi:Mg/Co/Ni transporter MgtE
MDLYLQTAKEIAAELEGAKERARSAVSQAEEKLRAVDAFSGLTAEQQEKVLSPITTELPNQIVGMSSIYALRHIAEMQAPQALQRARETVQQLANPEKKVEYARQAEKKIAFAKTELVSPEDVDAYAEALRSQWRTLVDSGKRIGL